MEQKHIIYKIWNDINDNLYIGITSRTIEERFAEHLSKLKERSETHLSRAIMKYGKEHFHIEQIDTAQSREEAFEKEKYYIKLFDTYNNGYNSTLGGEGVKTVQVDNEKIKTLYASGMSSEFIAEEMGISSNTVLRRLKAEGIQPNWRKRPDSVYNDMIRIYLETGKYRSADLELNLPEGTCRHLIIRKNIPRYPIKKHIKGGRTSYNRYKNKEITKGELLNKTTITDNEFSLLSEWYDNTQHFLDELKI